MDKRFTREPCNNTLEKTHRNTHIILCFLRCSDRALRTHLMTDLKSATKIIVAQRIGTIRNADKIIVLENERIAGMGKHEELLKNCAVYWDIARSQFSEEELSHA